MVWCGALLLFYLPLVFAVVELSSRYPQEGGLYVWTREAFGPFIGFMAGWSYFTSNLPYFPSVFYFDAGNALYIAGDHWLFLRHSATFFLLFALAAGLSSVLVQTWKYRSEDETSQGVTPSAVVPSLDEAVEWVLQRRDPALRPPASPQ